MSTSTDPRPQTKSRVPKAYTDEQLSFLRSHLPEFERRTQGAIRGDAKKFALDRAGDFIQKFALPTEDEVVPGVDVEARFREQIYNWYKNTVGRARRKSEGRPRNPPVKKQVEKQSPIAGPSTISWAGNLSPNVVPFLEPQGHDQGRMGASQPVNPTPYTRPQPSSGLCLNLSLRDAYLSPDIDASTLSTMIQTFAAASPSPTPLTAVVIALFDAISTAESQSQSRFPGNSHPHSLLRRYTEACSFFPSGIVHADVPGPASGSCALQMQIRKYSVWVPNPSLLPPTSSQALAASPSTSMSDSMHRIATDRQRRKDYILWARVHAAALELGMLDRSLRPFSEMMARDSVWEQDEVEWVAGVCVLRALIRTAVRGDRRQKDNYAELLKKYEGRWKEIRDEGRQEFVTEVLLDAKEIVKGLSN